MSMISQSAFDAVVNENMDEFGMQPKEALEDAIQTFKLQGADLTGIITDGSGSATTNSHPAVEAVKKLQDAVADMPSASDFNGQAQSEPVFEVARALEKLCIICEDGGYDSMSIAGRNGGVEAAISACTALARRSIPTLSLGLKALCSLLGVDHNRKEFRQCGGPQVIVGLMVDKDGISGVIEYACSIMSAVATADETMKENFMHLNSAEVLSKLLEKHAHDDVSVQKICNAFRSLVTADDDRIVVSKAFSNARKFAEAGMVETILRACQHQRKSSAVVTSLCDALKSLAVNEDICRSVAEHDGLSLVLHFLDEASKLKNKLLAKHTCSLLSQLAGSDMNKDTIVSGGGFTKIVQIMSVFMDDPSVLQEAMTAIAVLSLRSPRNAIKAVEAGTIDMVADAMKRYPPAAVMQRHACQMVRNLAVRSPENRSIILEKGLDILIRRAKANHLICKDAASAALRDLGFDDYNS